MAQIPITTGRRAFGDDPAAYGAARPDYPDGLYQRLVARCGLGPGSAVFEVGPGTGIATRRLLALGAAPLVAIEPDRRLADYLRGTVGDLALRVVDAAFEDAALEPAAFDLGAAATSFHWLEQAPALARVWSALKPGGWWAMWWHNFGIDEPDPFQAAIDHLFIGTIDSPSCGQAGRPFFALDREARLNDLANAGFEAGEAETWRWSAVYDTARLVGLYSTFSTLNALAPPDRARFFREFTRICERQFGGRIERVYTTELYTARKATQ
jgi:SAM-dependent methyltransferase